jgi:hypothetical protein
VKSRKIQELENRLLLFALIVLLGASVATAALHVNAAWQSPLIFLALIAILRLVVPVDEIHEDVKYLRGVAGLSVQTYPTVEAFYIDLRHAVNEAELSLDLTHIRNQSPVEFVGREPSEYFREVLDWVSTNESRAVRRIIAVRNHEMLIWAQQLAVETEQFARYRVHVIDWSIESPAINLALVDSRVAFLAVTGETVERTRGIAIEDEHVATYFVEYFNNLWREAKPLKDFLANLPENLRIPEAI